MLKFTEELAAEFDSTLTEMVDMYRLYERSLGEGNPDQANRWLKQAHKLRNALYGCIEGMEKCELPLAKG